MSTMQTNGIGRMETSKPSYKRIQRDHPAYEMYVFLKRVGKWMCDAVNHNSPKGCDNPDCYNYHKPE